MSDGGDDDPPPPPPTTSDQARDAAAHYDRVDVHRVALERRRELSTYAVRQLHNWIKRQQIAMHVARGDLVLDVAAGKGGDLGKLAAAGAAGVVLVDVSAESLREAQRRAPQAAPQLASTMRCVAGDAFSAEFWRNGAVDRQLVAVAGGGGRFRVQRKRGHANRLRFAAVSCQFALHYGFSTRERVLALLHAVHWRLRVGGVFFGITADGFAVEHLLRERRHFSNALFSLDARDSPTEPSDAIGASYRFTMADASVVDVREYVVHERTLRSLAEAAGFELVYYRRLPVFHASLLVQWHRRPPSSNARGRARAPVNWHSSEHDPDSHRLSSLYAAFALRRLPDTDDRTKRARSEPTDPVVPS